MAHPMWSAPALRSFDADRHVQRPAKPTLSSANAYARTIKIVMDRPYRLGAFRAGRSRVAPEDAGRRFFGRNLRGRTMFDVGSIFQSVWTAISEVILGQIMQLITDLLGGFLG